MMNTIRKRREALGIQQKEMAMICGIKHESMCRIEKRKNPPEYVDTILTLLERGHSGRNVNFILSHAAARNAMLEDELRVA